MLQAMIDKMSAEWQKQRANSDQMTLGEFIDLLRSMPTGSRIVGLGGLHSYRGYYSDLAFAPTDDIIDVEEVLDHCKEAMGRVFEGYKGGDFLMGENTPLWVSEYGDASGLKLMGIADDGTAITEAED